jgi:hypothetical protein
MDLYNIVYLLEYNLVKYYKKILENEHCDKGIALFIFWKLNKLYEFNKEGVINKIKNKGYKEIIKYNPMENKFCKNKWEIPEIMKKEIK